MRHSRRRRFGGRACRVLLVICIAQAVLAGCSRGETIPPPKPPVDHQTTMDSRAQTALVQLAQALNAHDPTRAAAIGAGGGRRTLGSAARNAAALQLTGVSMRYVADDQAGLSAAEQQRYGANAWLASVDLGYRIPRYDPGPTRLGISMVFVAAGDGVRIAAIGGHGARTPAWLWGRLRVLRGPRTLVECALPGKAPYYDRRAHQALAQVAEVLPDWRGRLVLDVPPNEGTLDAALDAGQRTYNDIAAVTTTVDGSRRPSSAVHVFVNPRVFGSLQTIGAQVVLTHESTHVATGASFASAQLPEWLLEGFADYVALAHAGVPVSLAAGQFIGRMRKDGVPRRLPTAGDLQPTAVGLGATYEEAWTANRSLALHYGEAQLVRFYRTVSAGTPVAQAFHDVLGTTQQRFVEQWRGDLRALLGSG